MSFSMNKIFKVIWNKTTQRLEVVSELAKGAVKSSSNSVGNLAKDLSKPVLKLSLLSICLGYPTWAMAATGVDKVDIMGYSHVNEMRIRLQKIVLLQLKSGKISFTITTAHIMNQLEHKETGLLPQA